MASMIRPNRLEVSDRFPILGFTVHTDPSPQWFEVALATDPKLFRAEAKAQRNHTNFYSSHAAGALPAERGEAVYLVPPEVLKRFAGQTKLYYGLATFPDPSRSHAEMVRVPSESSPYISIQALTGRTSRRMMAIPHPRNGHAGNGNGYGARNADELMWAGDAARPGTEAIANAPAVSTPTNGASRAPSTSAQPLTPPVAAPSASAAFAYDDGFGPMPLEATGSEKMEDHGIEEPIPDEAVSTQAMAYSRTFSTSEYPQASRFVQAKWYHTPFSPREINRIVIHITQGGPNINGTIEWFKNPIKKDGTPRPSSAHYIVGQNGEVVQMVKNSDIAAHAMSANSDSIGIEHNARPPGQNDKGLFATEAQYCSSAALVRWLCDQYNIPKDRAHILGHLEVNPGKTDCPNPDTVWDWDYYMGLVTSGNCYPKPAATSSALGSDMPLDAKTNGRSPVSKSPVYHRALGFAGIWREDIERLKTEFVANVQTGRKKNCIVIANASLRKFYGPNLQNSDGSDKRLGSTIQATMALLQSYGLAQSETVFEFNGANGKLTKGERRPDHLRDSVEAWLLNEADKNKMSTSYLFGLSIMDGYHSVLLAVNFNGIGDSLTKIYWADQIYSGWDDVTGGLDARITSRTQGWWDPLAAAKKARTRVTVWPLNPGDQIAVGQGLTAGDFRSRGVDYDDAENEDGIEGDEDDSGDFGMALEAMECSDGFCPENFAANAGTTNFTLKEFRCKDGTEVPEKFRGNVQEVMDNLEILRDELGGSPIKIVSGYRTCAYNKKIYQRKGDREIKTSRHICGQAADLQIADSTPAEVHATIERLIGEGRMQQGGLGIYKTFVHYDVRGKKARWDGRGKSRKSSASGLAAARVTSRVPVYA